MTYGENLVENLLKQLTKKRKDYYYIAEPTIKTRQSAHARPDFVIVSARQGVIVLEVKDWIKITEANQRKITIQRRDGNKAIEDNPVVTARKYAINLVSEFKRIEELLTIHRGRTKLKFPWIHAVAFPNIDSHTIQMLGNQNIWGDGVVFGKDELTVNQFEASLQSIRAAWSLEQPLGNEILNRIRAVLNPEIILPDAVGIETPSQTSLIRESLKVPEVTNTPKQQVLLTPEFLTNEASELAVNTTVRLVRGVAGSGKSLVLARRAQFLAEEYPDFLILVVAFNKDLITDLQRRIPGAANLQINHFHRICRSIVSRRLSQNSDIIATDKWLEDNMDHFLRSNQFSAEFVAQEIEWRKELEIYNDDEYLNISRDGRGKALHKDRRIIINQIFDRYMQTHHNQGLVDWSDLPRLALAELQQGHPMRSNYDVILIDEAQDFAPSWIAVVKRLLKPDGTLFMCDDPTQSLFRSFSWRQKGVEVVGRTRILRVPFRCTKEITLAAHSLISGDDVLGKSEEITTPDLTSYELATGNPPTLVKCYDLNDEIKLVEQMALSTLRTGMNASEIAILCHSKRIVKHWAHLRDKGFYVETFNKMKGLEFRTVILPHLNTAFDRHEPEKDETYVSESRRRIFTAMTRARDTLVLSYHGVLPQEMKLLLPYVQVMDG